MKKQKGIIEEKYFEDIFFKIRPLWKEKYIIYILDDENNVSFFSDYISSDDEQIDYILGHQKKLYNEWDSMLFFTFSITLYKRARYEFSIGSKILDLNDIPIEDFEKDYLSNLKEEGNEEYLAKYKGLKSKLN